jgi:hypothetical protein
MWADLFILATCIGAGIVLLPAPALRLPWSARLVIQTIAGVLALHLWLEALSLFGVPWRPVFVLVPLLALAVVGAGRYRRALRAPGDACGWGDAGALTALGVIAYCSYKQWITTSDFFYHWGAKGKRFFLMQGIDTAYLQGDWSALIVPWYPTLLSGLYGVTAIVDGRFAESPLMLWSVLWLALLVVAGRDLLSAGGVHGLCAQAAIISLACMVGTVTLQNRLVGGADWMISTALLVASRSLLKSSVDGESDEPGIIGLAAGFAAASKIEGIVLASVLLACFHLQRRAVTGRWSVKGLLASAWPTSLIVSLWLVRNVRYRLMPSTRMDVPSVADALAIAAGMWETISPPALYGFGLVALLAPLLLVARGTRAIGAAVIAQLCFYIAVYATATGNVREYTTTTFARLLFHLVPAILLGSVIVVRELVARRSEIVRG